ncbi:MAG: PIN domain-containing protein [Candidatus Woesearchaeota archaeon]|nr:PIN domain-containing protein [Candidatus Woesearchaeota archaeon]
MTRYYLDTSIWLDHYENRTDRFRPLGEWALALLSLIKERKDTILVSDVILRELGTYYSELQIMEIFKSYAHLIENIKPTDNQMKLSKTISSIRKIPMGDVLHAVLSKDQNAILVSRDNHFMLLTDINKAHKPEELI